MELFDGNIVLPVGTDVVLKSKKKTRVVRLEQEPLVMLDEDDNIVDASQIIWFCVPFREAIGSTLESLRRFSAANSTNSKIASFVDTLAKDPYVRPHLTRSFDAEYALTAFETVVSRDLARSVLQVLSERVSSVRDPIRVALYP
jgi:ligand-binding SRPBCC domain-containing protein